MRYPAIDLGALPVALINTALGTEISGGNVRLSRTAHRHMAEDHPDDYAVCIAHLPAAIASPTFIGRAPGHTRDFEMVKRVGLPDGRMVLVAIGLEPESAVSYRVRTSYLLEREKVDARRRDGRLHNVRPS